MITKILYEDPHLFVIHKPAGIAVQSAKVGQMDCESELKNYLARQGISPYIGLVHRLDQPVEGALVVARTKEATAKLNKQLTAGTLNKKYLAVVHLERENLEEKGIFVDYLLKEGQFAKVVSSNIIKEEKNIKEGILHYHFLQKKDDLALVDVEIETGRFHQIRCQMAYHGMPLLGDAKYGTNESKAISLKEGIGQVALCANRIAFKHPVTGKELSFEVQPKNKVFAKFL